MFAGLIGKSRRDKINGFIVDRSTGKSISISAAFDFFEHGRAFAAMRAATPEVEGPMQTIVASTAARTKEHGRAQQRLSIAWHWFRVPASNTMPEILILRIAFSDLSEMGSNTAFAAFRLFAQKGRNVYFSRKKYVLRQLFILRGW